MTFRGHLVISGWIICCCISLGAAHAAAIHAPASAHSQTALSNDDPNEDLALARLLQMKVDRGDAAAMNGLGMMYTLGRGVAKNYEIALHLFRGAALQGQVHGMVNLGLLYDRHTKSRDHSLSAYAWLRTALSFGVPDEDRDAILFRLGMLAARLGQTNAARAERLASFFVQDITERVSDPTDQSSEWTYK
jgi:hypothetical protein